MGYGITRYAIEIREEATGRVIERIDADREGRKLFTSVEARLEASRRRFPTYRARDGRRARVVVIDGE